MDNIVHLPLLSFMCMIYSPTLKVSVEVEQFLLKYTKLNIIVWHTSC